MLFVDVTELECELIDLTYTVWLLAADNVEPVNNLIHGIGPMHLQNVLIDWEHLVSRKSLDQLLILRQVLDGELFFLVFILFQEQFILNVNVLFKTLHVVGENDLDDELTECLNSKDAS